MPEEFSDLAIREHLPMMRAICAALEVEVVDNPSLEKKGRLFVDYFEKEFGYRKIRFSMMIFNTWLKGTDFAGDPLALKKVNPQAKWSDMLSILRSKIKTCEERLSSKEQRKTDAVLKFPKGTQWEDIEIRFTDGHTITVLLKNEFYGRYDNGMLGFKMGNTKDKRVNKPWQFLNLLAIAEQHRETRPPVKALFVEPLKTTLEGCDQIKGRLSRHLRNISGISEDPFYPYDPDRGYRIKIKLMPEATLRGDGELHALGGKLREEKFGNILEGMDD